jgi:hypothetical protein
VKRQRLSVVGGACAVVLISAAVAAATVGNNGGKQIRIAGGSQPTTTPPLALTSTTLPYDSSSAAPTYDDGPTSDGASYPTTPGTGTEPAELQPPDVSWSASMSVDATPVIVGDLVTVRADLRNSGTQPQQTDALAINCSRWPASPFGGEAAPGWPVWQFIETVIIPPGESRSFSMTFRADPQQVGGEATCTVGLVANDGWGGALLTWDAMQSDSVTFEIVAPTDSSTTTSSTMVPDTTTTIAAP